MSFAIYLKSIMIVLIKAKNPFSYLRSEKDILKLVNTIMANTKGEGEKSVEDFWVKAERLYYTALVVVREITDFDRVSSFSFLLLTKI